MCNACAGGGSCATGNSGVRIGGMHKRSGLIPCKSRSTCVRRGQTAFWALWRPANDKVSGTAGVLVQPFGAGCSADASLPLMGLTGGVAPAMSGVLPLAGFGALARVTPVAHMDGPGVVGIGWRCRCRSALFASAWPAGCPPFVPAFHPDTGLRQSAGRCSATIRFRQPELSRCVRAVSAGRMVFGVGFCRCLTFLDWCYAFAAYRGVSSRIGRPFVSRYSRC